VKVFIHNFHFGIPPQGHYFLKPASQISRTDSLLGSIAVKAIPIPDLGREYFTLP
jgi:hypothetical protein